MFLSRNKKLLFIFLPYFLNFMKGDITRYNDQGRIEIATFNWQVLLERLELSKIIE